MKFELLSDIGNVRKLNEDFCECQIINESEREIGIFFIADGMGGHNKGEVASKLAVESAIDYIRKNVADIRVYSNESIKRLIRNSYKYANKVVYKTSLDKDEYKGMGTTLTCALIIESKLFIANVGDSRCYIFKEGSLKKITKDNSLVEELLQKGLISEKESLSHPQRNVITRAIGTDEIIEIDFYIEDIFKGNVIILTTDGLTNLVELDVMSNIIKNNNDVKTICREFVRLAKENGGNDNISVICINFN